ncbi:unnamed protein product [Hymenolepis diminuta]|uniref:Extensin-like n=2 Tax=Hymenolepis diminuta TaxID=6216 RepID=A0A0R3SN49_HYMDI|nr:unnamed protein product [Hymenolepis diminuta]
METCAAQIPCPEEAPAPIVAQAEEIKPVDPCCNLRELLCKLLNCLCIEITACFESCAETTPTQTIVQSSVEPALSACDKQQVPPLSTAPVRSLQPVIPVPPTKPISKPSRPPVIMQQELPQVAPEPTSPTKPLKPAKASVSTKSVEKSLKTATEPPKPAKPSKSVKSARKSTKSSAKPPVAKSAVPPTGPELRPCLMRLIQKVDPELAGCLDTCNNSL